MVLHIKKRKPMRMKRVGMMRRVSLTLTHKLCAFFHQYKNWLMTNTFGCQQQERQRRRKRRTVLRKRQMNIQWNVQRKRRWVWVSVHTRTQTLTFPACLIFACLLTGGSGNKETEDRGERRLHRGWSQSLKFSLPFSSSVCMVSST